MSYKEIYQRSIEDREGFWRDQAKELTWYKFPQTILSKTDEDLYQWFEDGKLNMSYLCLDYHIEQGRGEQVAIIYDSPASGQVQKFTYNEVKTQVSKLAGVLKKLQVVKGDTVVIYMPMIPEAVFAMLACARLGAIHSVVFGGFAPHELAIRIDDAKPKIIISSNYGIEFDKKIEYKPLLDRAIEESDYKPSHTIIVERHGMPIVYKENFDLNYAQLMAQAEEAEPVEVNSTDPLYILYTSGTTGKPKGIVRDTGGYATALKFTMSHIYNVNPGDTFWSASDVGWVVGHSYIVYGPLLHGCTTVLFEGKPIRTPDAGTFWRVLADHKVNTFFTAPTAIRAIKKEDPEGLLMKKYDLSHLNLIFLAGERCDPATFEWLGEKSNKPVIDHWWQTESGWPMLGIQCGDGNLKPKSGSSNFPICGYEIDILDEDGQKLGRKEEGFVSVKLPLPPGTLMNLWQDADNFKSSYLSKFEGYYLSGDGGYIDEEGYYFIMGRIDDVINVAGHRLSTGEMEEILASHEAIAECAVIGIEDELRGQRPIGLVVLKDGKSLSEIQIEEDTIAMVRDQIGAVAFYRNTILVKRLPKTRSGKILRKTMRFIADGKSFTLPSTIDDPSILLEIEARLKERKIGLGFQ
jgi:propionyl-CoA synthetase